MRGEVPASGCRDGAHGKAQSARGLQEAAAADISIFREYCARRAACSTRSCRCTVEEVGKVWIAWRFHPTPTGSYKRKQGEDRYQKRADGTDVVIPYRCVMAPSGEDSPARNTRAKKNLRSLNIALKRAGHGVGPGRGKNPDMREVPVSSSPRARVFESYSGLSQTLDVVTCVPTDRVVQMIAADGTPYVGVEWAGDRTMTLRDRSDIEKCNKSHAETAMGASSKKDAKETEAETEPPGTPAKEEGTAPPPLNHPRPPPTCRLARLR